MTEGHDQPFDFIVTIDGDGTVADFVADAFNVDKDYAWLLDVGLGVAGGLLGGVIYNAVTTKPGSPMGPPQPDPGKRWPVDPYGP